MKKKDKVVTFLGMDTEFEGKLTFEGTIRIDGHFKGEIVNGGNLIIGEEGMVEANMHVDLMVIRGEVHGNITADQRVDILSPGKVFGNIQAPAVVIDEGVIFEGKTRMYQAKSGDEKSISIEGDELNDHPPSVTALFGTVKDQETGNPIRNAEVICKGNGEKSTKTNASGYYEQINLKEAKWNLKVKAKGYRTAKAKVVISGEGTLEQNFELKSK